MSVAKVFQSYFTTILFSKTIQHNSQTVINSALSFASFQLWEIIITKFFPEGLKDPRELHRASLPSF